MRLNCFVSPADLVVYQIHGIVSDNTQERRGMSQGIHAFDALPLALRFSGRHLFKTGQGRMLIKQATALGLLTLGRITNGFHLGPGDGLVAS